MKHFSYPLIHELVQERRFPHFFRSWQPGKYLLPAVISLRTAIFGPSSKLVTRQISKTAHYPRCRGSCHGSVSWFKSIEIAK